jgi:hypothetical protein
MKRGKRFPRGRLLLREADQRGEPRPETGGTMCDIGAFEVQRRASLAEALQP